MTGFSYIALPSGPSAGQPRPCIVTAVNADKTLSVTVFPAKSDAATSNGVLVLGSVRQLSVADTPEAAVKAAAEVAKVVAAEKLAATKAANAEVEAAAKAVADAEQQIEEAKQRAVKAAADAEKAKAEAVGLKPVVEAAKQTVAATTAKAKAIAK